MGQTTKSAEFLLQELEAAKARGLALPSIIKQWARPQPFDFDNLIPNGGFDSDTLWIKGTGWSIGSGVATHTGATAGYLQTADSPLSVGGVYNLGLGVTSVGSGVVQPYGSAYYGTSFNSVGSHELTIVSDANYIRFRATDDISIDNVTLFESDGTDIIHRLPEGFEVERVVVDGSELREGASHDYTIHTDGFTHWIKPAVAPGVNTETRIWGVRSL